jgi:hypothetical protein
VGHRIDARLAVTSRTARVALVEATAEATAEATGEATAAPTVAG